MESNPNITTLHNLLDYDTNRFISAEVQLKHILPEWINQASSLQFKAVLHRYLDFVNQHVEKFDIFSEEEEQSSLSLNNRVMQAFIEEANEKLSNCTSPEVKDACLLSCIQAINHFKISTYGTSAAFANTLEMEQAVDIFHEAEINEKHIDDRLSQLAEYEINIKAKSPVVLPG